MKLKKKYKFLIRCAQAVNNHVYSVDKMSLSVNNMITSS